jgi:hypothetical protein
LPLLFRPFWLYSLGLSSPFGLIFFGLADALICPFSSRVSLGLFSHFAAHLPSGFQMDQSQLGLQTTHKKIWPDVRVRVPWTEMTQVLFDGPFTSLFTHSPKYLWFFSGSRAPDAICALE